MGQTTEEISILPESEARVAIALNLLKRLLHSNNGNLHSSGEIAIRAQFKAGQVESVLFNDNGNIDRDVYDRKEVTINDRTKQLTSQAEVAMRKIVARRHGHSSSFGDSGIRLTWEQGQLVKVTRIQNSSYR